MSECVYKTHEGYCSLHSGSDVREYCVEGPCDDETFEPESHKENRFMFPMPGEFFRATGSEESVGTAGKPINLEEHL